ncbi:MAG: phosphoserine phosphatase SerB [Alphaproteobacteria bacterium]|nr:phosphoserine phosphatase SerB [Alphaproteobacteria bacterium]MDE2111454.1 phosphoserine phosphatase SerB [Alphaproteobacteria bacterium]MDE2494205.1 phosphoserine phosphatase SerB [Alphaproteobacteria bacterium]
MRFSSVLSVISENAGSLAADIDQWFGPSRAQVPLTWLSDDHAFEVPIAGDPAKALAEAHARASLLAADINVVPVEGRRKKLLIADMDSTIISCECLDELADMAGLKAKVSAITERAMRGEIEFAGALRERVALLKGLSLEALERVWRERVRLNPGAQELVATMKAHGAKTLLVSGGFTFFSSRVAEAAGFDEHQSNVLFDDGKALTGEVRDPILGKEAKLAALERALQRHELQPDDVLAVGDGANDLAMIQRAGLGVAYHAKPVVAAAAGASINHNDLTALLYLQGYREDEIVRS